MTLGVESIPRVNLGVWVTFNNVDFVSKVLRDSEFFPAIVSMFPLSCARVRAHKGHEMSAHKQT